MKISLAWLKSFAPNLSLTTDELTTRLTSLGLEVEGVEKIGSSFTGVVVGKVLETARHPNADKLTVCKVDVGSAEPLQIVCGAPNVAQGQTVPVAVVGAELHPKSGDPFKIKKSKLRGEVSEGMICAEDELGISDNHDGIMVLSESHKIGEPFEKYIPSDTVFDIGITPNRADALSHLGIARDLIGVNNIALPPAAYPVNFSRTTDRVTLEDKTGCPRYIAVLIEGVTIAPSPTWLQEKLKTIGLRPISNIVDITNYVLHSVGQPLHAFDLDKLSGKRIRVRSDLKTKFKTLDEKEREIEPGMVMICDAEKPVAIGGVMGGLESEISDSTKNVLLESAYFNPSSIRRTAKILGLSSDAAYRFERGVDPAGIELAAAIATRMILDLAGGTVTEMSLAEAAPVTKKTVSFRPARANTVLGTAIDAEQMVAILTRLGFEKSGEENGSIHFSVPTYRVDVDQEIDLIEDVARVYGYDNIAASGKMVSAYPATRDRRENFDERVRQLMLGFNYKELLTNPLLKQAEVEPFSEQIVRTLNPISEEMEALRPSLVPSLLKVVARNLNLGNTDQRLFEIGHTFELAVEGEEPSVPGYAEREVLSFALTGSREPKGWNQGKQDVDFYDLKGTAEALLHKLRILEKSKFIVYNPSCLRLEIARVVGQGTTQNHVVGHLWIVSQELLSRFDIAQPVYIAELELAKLKAFSEFERTYQEPAKFPVVHRDLAFLISKDVRAQDVVEEILKTDKLIEQVGIFDVFEGNAKDAAFSSRRSIAFSLSLVSRERTLTDKEIHALLDKVIERIKTKFGAELRQA